MAYNLQPLIQILHQILHPPDHHQPRLSLHRRERRHIKSLLKNSRHLIEASEARLSVTGDDVQILEDRIRDAAHRAQNFIEFFLASRSHHHLELLPKIDEEFKILVDDIKIEDKIVASSPKRDSAKTFLNPEQIFVGRMEDVEELKHSLTATGKSKKIKIVPIVGVDGIGKTTLARALYNDRSVISYFDCRAWVTIAESYSERDILLGLLACFPVPVIHERKLDYDIEQISMYIKESLRGRRYLIVLDNILPRNMGDWDEINNSFPENVNGSRILVTTGDDGVANYVTAGSPHRIMQLLDTESFDLLGRKVFGEETYTQDLENVGKEISRYCRGLPFAIHLVGGILLYLEKTKEAWEQLAERLKSCSDANDLYFVGNVLQLSYSHLPNYLKPCFLYMAAFPHDWEISSSKLIRLWVAEGFLKPIPDMSFEEAAEEYLMELVQRSLLMVHKQEIRGKVKSYIMHDDVRNFCFFKAEQEKFLYVRNDAMSVLERKDVLRLRVVGNIPYNWADHVAFAGAKDSAIISSLLLSGSDIISSRHAKMDMPLLRVWDGLRTSEYIFKTLVGDLFHLRYFAAAYGTFHQYRTMFRRNLQTLILENPDESLLIKATYLLDMPQLRHIIFKVEYPLLILSDSETVERQENLQTLSNLGVDGSFHRILEASPNLRKLGIRSCDFNRRRIDLRKSSKLEILKCSLGIIPHNIPHSLKKLTIYKCQWLTSEFLHEIGLLPNLEVLKLQWCCSDGDHAAAEWMPTEEEFQNLRLLLLSWTNLRRWSSSKKHYPRLERLVILDCGELEEIPGEIGYIPSLERIELLGRCRRSAEKSVERIRKDQLKEENDILQVYITSSIRSKKLARLLQRQMLLRGDAFLTWKGYLSNVLSIAEHPAISASEVQRMHDKQPKLGVTIGSIWRKMLRLPSLVQRHKKLSLKDDLSNALSTAEHPQNPSNPEVLVEISLVEELSMSVDLTLHAISSSSSNEMISFGLDPKRDDYSFSGVVKPKSGQASDGPVLGSRIMIGGDSESEEMLTLDEWRHAYVVTLTDKEHISLPEEPDCPNLIKLFLQRSIGIIDFPEKFFDHMPGLRSVDLSGTRIRELPEPLYKKPQLQVLMLKNCNRLLKLRSEIEDVESLEVLDLSGTELLDLPHKIGQLIGLRHLKLSFYGPDDEREFAHLPPTLMSTGNLSKLEKLQVLSIEVHPEDYRWKDIAAEITKDVVKLEELTYLQYYFPTEKSLEDFTSKSPSWAQRRLRKFKFIVGENVNRIVSRVPEEVETAYHKHDGCLRYVNGDKAHEAVKTVLERASAFYVDHISDIESLTQFGISNFKSVRFCVVRECPRITVLIANDESNESAFKKLQYLFIYYLWGLQQIWEESVPLHNFQRLKHLTVHTCPKLSFIVSEAMVECFSNLEEIVVQHCDSLEAIIQENAVGVYGGEVLPKLRILVLHYLPKLVTLGDGISLSEDQIIHVESCPMLNLEPQLRKLNQNEEQSSCRTVV